MGSIAVLGSMALGCDVAPPGLGVGDGGALAGRGGGRAMDGGIETQPLPGESRGGSSGAEAAGGRDGLSVVGVGTDRDAGADAGAPSCEEGARSCDARTRGAVLECGADGARSLVESCEGELPTCLDGACVECTPGEEQCSGTEVLTCSDDGGWEVRETCVDGEVCLAATLACGTCRDGDKQCDDEATVAVCEDGRFALEACGDTLPFCVAGGCVECSATSSRPTCEGDQPRVCVDGSWSLQPSCSGATPHCNTTLGACAECQPGETRCSASGGLERCSELSEWAPSVCDAAAPACLAGECVECEPDSAPPVCRGGASYACSAAGTYEPVETCSGSTPVCLADTGRCGSCEGVVNCQVDDKLGLGSACTSDGECSSGQCVQALSGTAVCCSEACDGTCEACGEDGLCNQYPTDDARCGTISCNADTACTDYPAALTNNRCAGAGRCVTGSEHCVPDYLADGTSCGSGLECNGMGSCVSVCAATDTWCTNQCVNTRSDDANCGGCGKACPARSVCSASSCKCSAAGEAICDGACVDTSTSLSHCGGCGNACGSGMECVQGACRGWRGAVKVGDGDGFSAVDVAMDASGNATVVFTATDRTQVRAWRRPAQGAVSAKALGNGGGSFQNYFYARGKRTLGLDAQGNAMAVWGNGSTYYARYQNGAWGSASSVTRTSYTNLPWFVMSPNGKGYVAYDDGVERSSAHVYFRHFNGSSWGSEIVAETDTTDGAALGFVAAAPNGDGLIGYCVAQKGYVRWYNGASPAWRGARQPLAQGCPSAGEVDAQGRALALSIGGGVVYGSSSLNGTTWQTSQIGTETGFVYGGTHRVGFIAPGGNGFAAFRHEVTTSSHIVQAATWDADSNTWQSAVDRLDGCDFSGFDWVADGAGSGFIVGACSDGIRARRRSGSTGTWAAEKQIETLRSGTSVFDVHIAISSDGRALLVWQEVEDSLASTSSVWAKPFE